MESTIGGRGIRWGQWTLGLALAVFLSLACGLPASAAKVEEYPLALETGSPRPVPLDIAAAPDGGAWFGEGEQSKLGYVSASGTLTEYPEPQWASGSFGVAVSKDGSVWTTGREQVGGKVVWGTQLIIRRHPDGTFSSYHVPEAEPGHQTPQPFEGDITEGPDGNIWFTELEGEHIGRLTPSGEAAYFPLPPHTIQFGITSGPDGALWFTQTDFETGASAIGRITTNGQVTWFPITGSYPFAITAGPDGALWFTEPEAHKIGRITTAGAVTYYPTPESSTWPTGITSENGVLWFANENQEDLGSITTGGKVTLKWLPEGSPHAGTAITVGTDGSLWYTDGSQNRIGRVDAGASYVALGDSYSSGEGNPPFEVGTNAPGDECHRSPVAYGPLLDSSLGLGSMAFRACSGAVTDDIFKPNQDEPPQLAWPGPATKTVTLTIGGNDAGFRSVLEQCVAGVRPAPPFEVLFGCSKDKQLRREVKERLEGLADIKGAATPEGTPIHSVLRLLEAIHAEAPAARLIIGGYPHLFGSSEATYQEYAEAPSHRVCVVGSTEILGLPTYFRVDYQDGRWLNSLADRLDSFVKKTVTVAQAAEIPVSYAAPTGFKEHGLCDSKTPWFNALELNPSTKAPESGSFHPNGSGQALGYEPAFAKRLR
jgi:streptogramin lyase